MTVQAVTRRTVSWSRGAMGSFSMAATNHRQNPVRDMGSHFTEERPANPIARFAASSQFHRPNASSLSGDFGFCCLVREMNPQSPWICCRANGSSLPGTDREGCVRRFQRAAGQPARRNENRTAHKSLHEQVFDGPGSATPKRTKRQIAHADWIVAELKFRRSCRASNIMARILGQFVSEIGESLALNPKSSEFPPIPLLRKMMSTPAFTQNWLGSRIQISLVATAPARSPSPSWIGTFRGLHGFTKV